MSIKKFIHIRGARAHNLKNIEDNSEKQGLTAQTFLDDLPDVVESEGKEVEIPLSD